MSSTSIASPIFLAAIIVPSILLPAFLIGILLLLRYIRSSRLYDRSHPSPIGSPNLALLAASPNSNNSPNPSEADVTATPASFDHSNGRLRSRSRSSTGFSVPFTPFFGTTAVTNDSRTSASSSAFRNSSFKNAAWIDFKYGGGQQQDLERGDISDDSNSSIFDMEGDLEKPKPAMLEDRGRLGSDVSSGGRSLVAPSFNSVATEGSKFREDCD